MSEINPILFIDHMDALQTNEGLQSRIIDLSKIYPEIDYLFERDGQSCFSLGDIQVIKGKAKSGKSTFMISLLCALLTGENMGFKALKIGCKSMYVDTEQNPINTVKIMKKIHHICGLPMNVNDDRFTVLNLRGDNPPERKTYIREAAEAYNPQFIIIDGIKDIIEGGDINAIKESGEAVQFLMSLTKQYNVAVMTVIHENKNDTNMRGHVGSELLNKCSEAWEIKKGDSVFIVEQIANRNDAPNTSFSFEFDENKLPVLVDNIPKESVKDRNLRIKMENFRTCLQPNKSKEYKKLANDYCEIAGVALKTAYNHISDFIKRGYLFKESSIDEYKFNYLKDSLF